VLFVNTKLFVTSNGIAAHQLLKCFAGPRQACWRNIGGQNGALTNLESWVLGNSNLQKQIDDLDLLDVSSASSLPDNNK
jgi:hypothetical protein